MKKFSVVLTHYNQMEYIYESLNSIFMQDYGRIELIITDDCSKEFDKEGIKEYIEKNKNTNIEKYTFITNSKNIGTVKTLNKALKYVTGEYVLFFAADDALFDLNVISSFVKEFDNDREINVLTSQTYMCKEKLIVNEECTKFVPVKKALKYNKLSAQEQYYFLSNYCLFVSGATAYRKKIFDTMKFDEDFKLAEDWSFWLELNMNGIKIKYIDYISLLHRTGGISHLEKGEIPEHVKIFYMDDLRVYTKLIIPNLSKFKNKYRNQIIDKYLNYLDYYETIIPNIKLSNQKYTELALQKSHYNRYLRIKKIKNKINMIIIKYNIKAIILKYLLFIILSLFVLLLKGFNLIILAYISFTYFFSLFTYKAIKIFFRRLKNDRRKNI